MAKDTIEGLIKLDDLEAEATITVELPFGHWLFELEQALPDWSIDAGTD